MTTLKVCMHGGSDRLGNVVVSTQYIQSASANSSFEGETKTTRDEVLPETQIQRIHGSIFKVILPSHIHLINDWSRQQIGIIKRNLSK